MGGLDWSTPFPVKKDPDTALLFMHGFLETPMSFTYLSEQLAEETVVSQFGTLLPGHGSTPRRLSQIHREDWYTSVKRDVDSLGEQYSNLYLCGYSLGGLLSYIIAHEQTVDGLILLAPSFRYCFSFMKWVPDRIKGVIPYFPQFGIDGLNDRTLDKYFAHYVFMPMAAVSQLSRLQEEVEQRFPPAGLSCPVLTLQSTSDWVIDHETTVSVARQFNHPASRHRLFERSNHALPLDHDRKQVAGEIIDFLADC